MAKYKILTKIFLLTAPSVAYGKNTYLNGVDISSAINQNLEQVDVHINERGDIFISAPNYEVHEEASYQPLSKSTLDTPALPHKGPAAAIAAPTTPVPSPTAVTPAPAGTTPEPMAAGGDASGNSS